MFPIQLRKFWFAFHSSVDFKSSTFSLNFTSVLALAIDRNFARIACFDETSPLLVLASHRSHACSLWKSQMYVWQSMDKNTCTKFSRWG